MSEQTSAAAPIKRLNDGSGESASPLYSPFALVSSGAANELACRVDSGREVCPCEGARFRGC